MNGKATKQTLVWPPKYNFSKDEPVIDTDWQTVESLNAPLLNNMLSPVWEHKLGGKYVHDKYGNKYSINGNYFQKNDVNLFEISNEQFSKEDITDKVAAFRDIDFVKGAYRAVKWNDYTRTLSTVASTTLDGLNTASEEELVQLPEGAILIATRLRVFSSADYAYCAYYTVGSNSYMYVCVDDVAVVDRVLVNPIGTNGVTGYNWMQNYFVTNVSTAPNIKVAEPNNASKVSINPIWYISKVNNYYGISLISNKGSVVQNSKQTAWISMFASATEGVKRIGVEILPENIGGTSTEITEDMLLYIRARQQVLKNVINGTCLSSDNSTYYDYTEEGVVGPNLNIPTSYVPSFTGNKVTIDNIEYSIYNYTCTKFTSTIYITTKENTTLDLVAHGRDGVDYTGSIVDDDACTIGGYVTTQWRGQDPVWGFDSVEFDWEGETRTIDDASFGQGFVKFKAQITTTVEAKPINAPVIFLDDGVMYGMVAHDNAIYTAATSWSNALPAGSIVLYSADLETVGETTYTYRPHRYSFAQLPWSAIYRSNSVGFAQNFIIQTDKFNNTNATTSTNLYRSTSSESIESRFVEAVNTNVSDLRFGAGTNRYTDENYFGGGTLNDPTQGNAEDAVVMTAGGWRTRVRKDSNFYILQNTYTAGGLLIPLGVSFAPTETDMGTLLTPVNSLDPNFYVSASEDEMIYKDGSGRVYRITIEAAKNDLKALADDRYILINTTSYWNMWDSVMNRKLHYAADENGRTMFGSTTITTWAGANSSGITSYIRAVAAALNPRYAVLPRIPVTGVILPYKTCYRVLVGNEQSYQSATSVSLETQGIDVYYTEVGQTVAAPPYKYTLINSLDGSSKVSKNTNVGTTYPLTSSSSSVYPVSMFAEFINNQGNNDLIKENYAMYILNYYGNQAVFNYAYSSETLANFDSDIAFFVIQGQYYAFMNEKIYSILYSGTSIASQEAIIDARGMKFIGNTPMIAFFYSPSKRAIYSFTGDANLAKIFDASKFSKMGYDDLSIYRHWYDETTQSIFAATDAGLLVFGPNNTYCFEDWTNVTNVQFSNDNVTHVTNGGETVDFVYYPKEGFTVKPLNLETAFFGIGANQSTSIDRWDIVLYDFTEKKEKSYIKVGVRSMTDMSVRSEDKVLEIMPNDYDKWSSSILIRYVPKLIKGQGIRLYLETPLIVQRIVPHYVDNGTGTTTRRGM